MEYVKEVEGGWEVKLGAGILPLFISKDDLYYMNRIAPNSTVVIPERYGDAANFVRICKATQKINEYLYSEKK